MGGSGSEGGTVMGAPAPIEQLPPSASHVLYVLEHCGPLTQAELVEESYLAARTTRWAVRRLTEEGILETAPAPDARQCLYLVADGRA